MVQIGEVLDNTYRIEEEIGHGGGGVVYRATHLRLQKQVVVKKILDRVVNDMDIRREVDVLKQLHHMYLPQVYDFFILNGQVFTVIDFVEGHDLKYYLDQGYVFPEEQLRLWLGQLCQVLTYMHTHQPPVIHGDVKPDNIMLTPQGNICLIDFNISLAGNQAKQLAGLSRKYAAPEQMEKAYRDRNVTVDHRVDIFCAGAAFYHLMTGQTIRDAFGNSMPPAQFRTTYSPGFVALIEKAMEERPSRRFQTAERMYHRLQHLKTLDHRYIRLRNGKLAAAALYAVFMILCAGCVFYGSRRITNEEYSTAFAQFEQEIEKESYGLACETGIDLLNTKKYQRLLEKNPAQKCNIFYALGTAFYEQEDFLNAVVYYKKAVESEDAPAEYHRDYARALAARKQYAKAENEIKKAARKGLSEDEADYVRAEIAYERQDYETAEDLLEQTMTSTHTVVMENSYLLQAKILCRQGRNQEAIQLLKSCRNQSKNILRMLGDCYLKDHSEEINYDAVISCYEKLCGMPYPAFEDRLNLAVLYGQNGQLEQSDALLGRLKAEYPKECRVYLQLALNACEAYQNNEAAGYTKIEHWYEKAKETYDAALADENTIYYMNELEKLLERLRE